MFYLFEKRFLNLHVTSLLVLLGLFLPSLLSAQLTAEAKTVRGFSGETGELVIELDGIPAGTKYIGNSVVAFDGSFYSPTGSDADVLGIDSDVFVYSPERSSIDSIIFEASEDLETSASATITIPINFSSFGSTKASIPIGIFDSENNMTEVFADVTIRASFIKNEAPLFALLAMVVMMIYGLTKVPALESFFKFFPPLVWMYFIPMVLTTFAITPDKSSLYSPFMSRVLLPAILVLLIIPSDIRTVLKLGPKAIIVMLIATFGITVGAIGSFGIFHTLFAEQLPVDTWKGVAGLAGSWIGGSTNMTVLFESFGASPNIIGPMIIVDTILAYSWLGVLVGLSGYQKKADAFLKADSSIIEELSERVKLQKEDNDRSPAAFDIAVMFGLAFGVSQLCLYFGPFIYGLFNPEGIIASTLSGYAWGILLITAVSLFFSTTPVRKLDYCGASSIGYIGLYLLLTTYGARADLKSIFDVPLLFGIGSLWLIIHIIILFIGIRLVKAPLFLGATSSMANIGGTASAPVVAASYYPTMAPVGLLMGILGGVLGTPMAFFIAAVCRKIAGQ